MFLKPADGQRDEHREIVLFRTEQSSDQCILDEIKNKVIKINIYKIKQKNLMDRPLDAQLKMTTLSSRTIAEPYDTTQDPYDTKRKPRVQLCV